MLQLLHDPDLHEDEVFLVLFGEVDVLDGHQLPSLLPPNEFVK